MKWIIFLMPGLILINSTAFSQPRKDLYRCEGCEAIYEHSFDKLTEQTVILSDGGESLVLSGTVYQVDGTSPAQDVIIYAYHTNKEGVYPKRGNETGWARRHGYLRGWVKTDSEGRYSFHTIRPGAYPGRSAPAHIHMTLKEPDHREYWIDEVVFTDDPFVTRKYQKQQNDRGGSGIITLTGDAEGGWMGVRDIILEQHPED